MHSTKLASQSAVHCCSFMVLTLRFYKSTYQYRLSRTTPVNKDSLGKLMALKHKSLVCLALKCIRARAVQANSCCKKHPQQANITDESLNPSLVNIPALCGQARFAGCFTINVPVSSTPTYSHTRSMGHFEKFATQHYASAHTFQYTPRNVSVIAHHGHISNTTIANNNAN
jgi:hypothetical protein